MGLLELLLIAVGLAMDAFAVSVCKGLAVKKVGLKESLICGIWFGLFQAGMPLLGYLLGSGFVEGLHRAAPWVACALLSVIGVRMAKEAFEPESEQKADFGWKTMLLLAIATSIDALAVGVTFVAVPLQILKAGEWANTLFGALVIGVITLGIAGAGVKLGNLFGARLSGSAEVLGGGILVFIGLKTLLRALQPSGEGLDLGWLFEWVLPLMGAAAAVALTAWLEKRKARKKAAAAEESGENEATGESGEQG